jgi:hypothetical protein
MPSADSSITGSRISTSPALSSSAPTGSASTITTTSCGNAGPRSGSLTSVSMRTWCVYRPLLHFLPSVIVLTWILYPHRNSRRSSPISLRTLHLCTSVKHKCLRMHGSRGDSSPSFRGRLKKRASRRLSRRLSLLERGRQGVYIPKPELDGSFDHICQLSCFLSPSDITAVIL